MDNNYNDFENVSAGAGSSDQPVTPKAPENAGPEPTPSASGEYHFVHSDIPSAEPAKEEKAAWSDPVIDKADHEPDTFYSPNFHSGSYAQGYTAPASQSREKQKSRKKHGGFVKALCLVLACVLLSAAAGGAVTYSLINHYGVGSGTTDSGKQVVLGSTASGDTASGAPSSAVQVTGDVLSASDIYNLAVKSVVGVNTSVVTQNIFGQETAGAVSGSGFVISSDGYILTNYHVIEYSAVYNYDLKVIAYDGTEYPAEIVGYDSENDVAVIKIDASGLTPVTFGNSDNMSVGEGVYAVGNPLGELTFSMTSGMISALDRVISTDASTAVNMFQFDAAVNSGNSGGPVYNSKGEVLGIVTAKYASTGVEGLGFAIPINDAVAISKQLIEDGYVSGRAYLGVYVDNIEDYVIQYYGIPEGAYVSSVNQGSCSEKAGLQKGDIITSLGGAAIKSVEELKTTVKLHSAGETVELEVYRAGETLTLSLTFDEAPASGSSDNSAAQQTPGQQLPGAPQSDNNDAA